MHRYQQTKHALGSTAYLTLVLPDEVSPDDAFGKLWKQVDDFERRFSRFLADSELTRFNNEAGTKCTVSSEFRELLSTARSMAEKTDGLYNPLILPSLQRAGYKGSWPQPENVQAALNYEGRELAAWQGIEIGDTWARIPKDSAVDFGGIGKGYLLDMLADTLSVHKVENYWLSLGGDILCAGNDEPGTPWIVGVQDAMHEDRQVCHMSNEGKTMAIATSGITKRKGTSGHGPWHHLIDPRTGLPAKTDILTATMCASTATEADVYAKCLVILGDTDARAFIKTIGVENALLQRDSGNTTVVVEMIGSIWSQ